MSLPAFSLRIAAVLYAVVALSGGTALASPVEGTWEVKDDVVLNIFGCGGQFCARIVWMKDAARRSTQCGRTIAWGLQPKTGSQWEGGSIVDPDDNKIYRLAADAAPDGTIHAHIFRGIQLMGKTEILRRVDMRPITGNC
jgi:uncharacterized protein (DUF2147 family)